MVVNKHLHSHFRRPFPDHSLAVFEQAQQRVAAHQGPIIFDSFCGVGESTAYLANRFPTALVIGLDKSLHRLNKHGDHYRQPHADNYLLLRADVDDFWRQAEQAGWRLQAHFLFYPNPWPKSSQLQRRIHGSPLFPTLLKLGGAIELRSNWRIYVEEFAAALQLVNHSASVEAFAATAAVTPFERKYSNSGQPLWRCTSTLR